MPQQQQQQERIDESSRRSVSTFFTALALSPLTLSLSPSLLSVVIYLLCISAFISPFFTVSLARCEFLVLTKCCWSYGLAPTLFYLLYLLLSFALCIAVCLSLSFVTVANSIGHDSH